MRRAEPEVWAVFLRRVQSTTVYVKHADPVEARAIAADLADTAGDWKVEEQATAYIHHAHDVAYWSDGFWIHPQQTLEGETK